MLRFTAQLRRRDAPGTTTFTTVPRDVMETFAPAKRLPVNVAIGGHTWRSTIGGYGDEYLGRCGPRYARIGKNPGDSAVADICRDEAPRTVAIPNDLHHSLTEAGARTEFAAFSFSHQIEFVRWVDEGVRPETRFARIEKTVERTKLKRGLSR